MGRPAPAALLAAAAALILAAAGCVTSVSSPRDAAALPPADVARAQSWAHYAHGLLLEAEHGRGSPEATEAFRLAHALDPEGRQPTEALALNLLRQSRRDEALEILATRCRRLPKDRDAQLALARTAEIAGDYPRAAVAFGRAHALQPQTPGPAMDRVRCLFAARQDDDALAAMRRLHRRQPSPETRQLPLQWAVAFVRQEQEPRRALPCLALAAEWATNATSRALHLALLAQTTLSAGETNAAQRAFQRALDADSGCVPALQGLGSLFAARKDTNGIARLAARAPARADPLPDFLVAAHAFAALENREEVVRVLTAARHTLANRRLPVPENLFLQLGAALDELDRDDEAARVFQDALALFPQSHTILNYLAYMWAVNATRLEEAGHLVVRALELEPDNGAYLDTLGWVRYRQGRFTEALPYLIRALRILGDDPVVLDHTGDTLAAIGRIPEAIAYWSRSYALDPDQPGLADKLRRHGVDSDALLSPNPPPPASPGSDPQPP